MHIIVSHPARQGNIYERPRAAEHAGLHIRFLTGLYYRPESFPYSLVRLLPSRTRARIVNLLEKRRTQGLSPDNVVSLFGPALEVILRPIGLIRYWDAAHDWLASRWIRKYVRQDVPTVLHAFQGAALRTLRAAQTKGALRLLEITLPPVVNRRARQGLLKELAEADFLVAQSKFSEEFLIKLGVQGDRIIRVHQGVDAYKFHPRTTARHAGPLRIIFVGTICRRKGVDVLLRAWNELGLDNAQLQLIGRNGTEEAAQVLQLKGRTCESLGHVSDAELLELFQHADILVHPSLAEGGCNVIYEALACGVPSIVSSNSGSAVRDGIEGIVVSPGDVSGLKAAIERLCTDHTLRDQMSTAARKRAEMLTWDNYRERLGDLYVALGQVSKSKPEALLPQFRGEF
jgi:glycosyltransferase involved in cell wall biosynthesis